MSADSVSALPIRDRIRSLYPGMTGSLRRFADHVLAEPIAVARSSIHAAVERVGVSVATANRFARALGYAGYAEFRAELIQSFAEALAPVQRLERQVSTTSTSLDVMRASLQEDVGNLQATLDLLTAQSCDRAVELILSARRVHTLGFDSAAALAWLLANGLAQVRDGVSGSANMDGGFGAARQLCRFGSEDVVIAVAFPRYMRETLDLARQAKARGARLIALTDGHRSPLARIADVSLYAEPQRQFAAVSNASALALIEALVAAVAHRAPDAIHRAEEFASFVHPWLEASGEGR
jgi:DNA-binding MurR/RpiR family transcriptional regulator